MFRQVALECKQFDCSNAYVDLCISRSDLENCPIERVPVLPDLIAVNFQTANIERFCHRLQTWTSLNGTQLDKFWFDAQLIGSKLYTFGEQTTTGKSWNVIKLFMYIKNLKAVFGNR